VNLIELKLISQRTGGREIFFFCQFAKQKQNEFFTERFCFVKFVDQLAEKFAAADTKLARLLIQMLFGAKHFQIASNPTAFSFPERRWKSKDQNQDQNKFTWGRGTFFCTKRLCQVVTNPRTKDALTWTCYCFDF
jgi:hypothetical protein